MKLSLKESKSILTPSKLPGSDYVINPYSGCAFGCVYCYADFTRRFTGHIDDNWGEYVDVKINAVDVLKKELERLNTKVVKKSVFKNGDRPFIFFGSVTDPYQGVEAKFELTRDCLIAISESRVNGLVDIGLLTKSPLVTRDIDIFKSIPNLEVGMTVSSNDDGISKLFESYAPPSSLRIKALKELNSEGIKTHAFVGPLLPHFVANEGSLVSLFRDIRDSGTKRVWVEHINLSGSKMDRLVRLIGDRVSKSDLDLFVESQSDSYKRRLSDLVIKIVKDYDLELVGDMVIDHLKG